ncbi:MAG: TRAP transporter substrate-binding protein DctP [Oscillospiraceae bacterium]|nr:TRAP transporter substrate-binding protein DctP [Oscillospiraceae bacterium]
MKKTRIIAVLALVLIVAMLFAGCSNGAPQNSATPAQDNGKVYTFKIDYPNPENSGAYIALTEWSQMLKEQSNGRLDMQICANGQLGSIKDCVSNCVGGLTDGFWSAMTIYAGLYRPAEALTLPMMGVHNADVASATLTAMLEQTDYYTESLSNLYVVTLHSATTMPIGFKDSTPVTKMADLKGLNMRVTGGFNSNWVTAIGANPINAGSNEGYEYLEKGIINSYLYDWDKIQSGALLEQTGYIVDAHCCASELFFCLNKEKYNELPDDLKALIDGSQQWFRDRIGQIYAEQRDEMVAKAEAAGITVEPINDEFNAELTAAAEDVWAAWIKEMNEAGYDGQGIFDKTREFIEYYNGIYDYYN